MAKWIIIVGSVLVVLGVILHFFPSAFSWFGKLPGDINYESDNGTVFIPITSMIVVSIVLTVLINLFRH